MKMACSDPGRLAHGTACTPSSSPTTQDSPARARGTADGGRRRPGGLQTGDLVAGGQMCFHLAQDLKVLAGPEKAESRPAHGLVVPGDHVAHAFQQPVAAVDVAGCGGCTAVSRTSASPKVRYQERIARSSASRLLPQRSSFAWPVVIWASDDSDSAACRTRPAPATRAAKLCLLAGGTGRSARYWRKASSRRSAAAAAACAALAEDAGPAPPASWRPATTSQSSQRRRTSLSADPGSP